MIEEIVLIVVAHNFKISKEFISKKTSQDNVVKARKAYVHILTEKTTMTLRAIGKKIDVSHDMVIYYKKEAAKLMASDVDFEFRLYKCFYDLEKFLEHKRNTFSNGFPHYINYSLKR